MQLPVRYGVGNDSRAVEMLSRLWEAVHKNASRNFGADNMALLERNWDAIGDSLKLAAGLLDDFGLSGGLLTADSVLIPVAYYVHTRGLTEAYRHSDKPANRQDRGALRSWVPRSLVVRGIWGSGLDTLLRDLRVVIRWNGMGGFPLGLIERAMAARGKSLAVTDELIGDILDLSYGGGRTWAVLATLFDHVDTQQQYHVDQVFPRAQLDQKVLKAAKSTDGSRLYDDQLIADLIDKRDRLANLEQLPGMVNVGKSDTEPDVWIADRYPGDDERTSFVKANALPTPPPHTPEDFPSYFRARRVLLVNRIKDKLRTGAVGGAEAVVEPLTTTEVLEDALAEAESAD